MNVSSVRKKDNVVNTSWKNLPVEIWLEIFKYLPKSTIVFIVRHVCKMFKALSMDLDLWHTVDMNNLKETTHVDYLSLDTTLDYERGDDIDKLAWKLLNEKHLSNTDLFCPIFGCIGTTVLELSFSRYVGDFVLGEKEKLTLYQCSHLKYLDAGFCESISPSVLEDICASCSNLQVLILDSCRLVKVKQLLLG